MSILPHLPHDAILLILAHTPLDAISISQVCRDLHAPGELSSYWLTALKGLRTADIFLTCTVNLNLNALLKDPEALKPIALRTFIRERNWTSPDPRLIEPASRVSMSDDFTILFIIPGTPRVLFGDGKSSVPDPTNFRCIREPPTPCHTPEQGRCLLVVEDTFARFEGPLVDDLIVVNLTYSPDYHTASMTVIHSFLLRRCPSRSKLSIPTFTLPSTNDNKYALRYSFDTLLNADSLPLDTPIPVRLDVPASEYGKTIFSKSYGGTSLRRYCFPADQSNAILVDIQNFKLQPYARRW
ncbi:hypothetical protein C8J56DRAFT_1172292 [Mycena floridula]|nr:hypothetical protein C8J56DRAFT_1172292 [Mycena floridula]